jgi:hypothetical protein
MVAMVVVVMVELKRDEGCRWERKVRRGKDGKEWVRHRERRRAFLKERRREQSRQARERETKSPSRGCGKIRRFGGARVVVLDIVDPASWSDATAGGRSWLF